MGKRSRLFLISINGEEGDVDSESNLICRFAFANDLGDVVDLVD